MVKRCAQTHPYDGSFRLKDGAMSREITRAFLSFTLAGLEYGLDARQVLDLCPLDGLDRFADARGVVPGVARARGVRGGVIMPIVDLRAAFAGHPLPPSAPSQVVILTLAACVIGMVVESVNGTVILRPDDIKALPCVDGAILADYLLGLGESGARRLVLVDIDRLMTVGQHKTDCLV
jgi:purine-binding chemotaxis protein CheW